MAFFGKKKLNFERYWTVKSCHTTDKQANLRSFAHCILLINFKDYKKGCTTETASSIS